MMIRLEKCEKILKPTICVSRSTPDWIFQWTTTMSIQCCPATKTIGRRRTAIRVEHRPIVHPEDTTVPVRGPWSGRALPTFTICITVAMGRIRETIITLSTATTFHSTRSWVINRESTYLSNRFLIILLIQSDQETPTRRLITIPPPRWQPTECPWCEWSNAGIRPTKRSADERWALIRPFRTWGIASPMSRPTPSCPRWGILILKYLWIMLINWRNFTDKDPPLGHVLHYLLDSCPGRRGLSGWIPCRAGAIVAQD